MSVFQHHPDNIIYIRVGQEEYADLVENFNIDCQSVLSKPYVGLPTNATSKIYLQEDPAQHTTTDSHGNVTHLSFPWKLGDEYIANFGLFMEAKALRELPTPEEEFGVNKGMMVEEFGERVMAHFKKGFTTSIGLTMNNGINDVHNLTFAYNSAVAQNNTTMTVRDLNNTMHHDMDIAAVNQIITEMSNDYHTKWLIITNLSDEIKAATTEAELSQIDLTAI